MCDCSLIYFAKLLPTPMIEIRIAIDNTNPKIVSPEMPSLGPYQDFALLFLCQVATQTFVLSLSTSHMSYCFIFFIVFVIV